MKKIKVSIVQNNAGRDVTFNLNRIRELVSEVEETDLIAIPEVFALKGSQEEYEALAESVPGRQVEFLASLATSKNAWVLGGSIIEREGDRLYNTTVLVDRNGDVQALYRKIHLFEFHLDDGKDVCEADVYSAGKAPVTADLEGWHCGFTICYDLRFPELYRAYSRQGVKLIFIPSNFTRPTGRAHWEILVRARAIENQCFVVAPNQCGANTANGVPSYGHSMVVDPWGEVLAKAENLENILTCELDPVRLEEAGKRVPALDHRVM